MHYILRVYENGTERRDFATAEAAERLFAQGHDDAVSEFLFTDGELANTWHDAESAWYSPEKA